MTDNVKNIRVLAINYRFINRSVNGTNLAKRAKEYYEQNSRGKLKIDIDVQNIEVPKKMGARGVVEIGKKLMKKGYDINIHFCNPTSSHTGQGNVITYASYTNTVHELGHALGLTHAYTHFKDNGLKGSRDPFDQMTMFAPYPSTNAVHRWLKGWFYDTEFLNNPEYGKVYELGQLKNLKDKDSLKVIRFDIEEGSEGQTTLRKYFISHGVYKNSQYITIHTMYGKNSSILLDMLKIGKQDVFENRSGLIFEVIENLKNTVKVKITYKKAEKPELLQIAAFEDCECEHNNIDDEEDSCTNCMRIVNDDDDEL